MSTHAEIMAVYDEEVHPRGRRGILNTSDAELSHEDPKAPDEFMRQPWRRRNNAAQKRVRYLIRKGMNKPTP